MNIIEDSKKHLELSQVDYFNHFKWAIKSGFILILIGFASLIHGVVPAFFKGTTAKKVIEIFYQHLYNHPNKEYQNIIREEFLKSVRN